MPSYKIVKSGHVIEVYKYAGSIMLKDYDEGMKKKKGEKGKGKEERKEEYKMQSNMRARQAIRRLILANFDENDLFITLTFRDNIKDVEWANKEFNKFIKKLKRRVGNDLKYVAVIEFQKRGAIHYHCIMNLRLEWKSHQELQEKERALAEVWGHGFVDIQSIRHVDNVGAYLTKYMTKETWTVQDKKRYLASRNLVKPRVLEGDEFRETLKKLEGEIPVFTSNYYGEFTGHVQYKEYNLKRYKKGEEDGNERI